MLCVSGPRGLFSPHVHHVSVYFSAAEQLDTYCLCWNSPNDLCLLVTWPLVHGLCSSVCVRRNSGTGHCRLPHLWSEKEKQLWKILSSIYQPQQTKSLKIDIMRVNYWVYYFLTIHVQLCALKLHLFSLYICKQLSDHILPYHGC